MTLDEAINKFRDFAQGKGDFDELDLKEVIVDNRDKAVREARIDGAIMGAKFGNAAFRQQSIAEPGKAINLDKVRDSGIKQAVAWARENL